MKRSPRFHLKTLALLATTLVVTACGGSDAKVTCSATESCGFGLTCQDETCVAAPCAGPADCPSGYTCTVAAGEGLCTAIECGCDTCDACPAGDVCSAGLCVPEAGCSESAPCTGTDVCEAGACRPCAGAECATTCTAGSCPAGQVCNATSGACEAEAALGTCGACTDSAECGADGRCIQLQGGKACLPTCATEGQSCNASGACEAAAACNPSCSGSTPVCNGGTCVECVANADCGAGRTCNTATNLCEGQTSCTGATPYALGDQCVECLTNSHCGDRFCDQATHTCSDDQCASCADPYPACIDYEGQSYCVQCATNEDCVALNGEGSTCNTSTYACEGGVVRPADTCETDNDCASGAAGFNLRCHVASGFCYDVSGSCDDVTAFCPGNDGQVRPCQSLLSLLGGGGSAPALPPELAGGGTLPGFCSCTPGPLGLGAGSCLAGQCTDLGALLALLGGGGSGGSSSPVCFDLSSLGGTP
jgi:Cys-rich repeat protein